MPGGLGFATITGLTKLMQDNKDQQMFSKMKGGVTAPLPSRTACAPPSPTLRGGRSWQKRGLSVHRAFPGEAWGKVPSAARRKGALYAARRCPEYFFRRFLSPDGRGPRFCSRPCGAGRVACGAGVLPATVIVLRVSFSMSRR